MGGGGILPTPYNSVIPKDTDLKFGMLNVSVNSKRYHSPSEKPHSIWPKYLGIWPKDQFNN